ncbi:MAG: hypothetical protein PWP51_2694 [Clostridiales bacterium]|nr:hypothetical protein [Clostridiales bacterium]
MTEIYIISGFLGAGKTTLIQKMLQGVFRNRKVALIENDFGDVNIDSALLATGEIEVQAINAGCICCSLSGDFINALKALLTRFEPEVVIIEPSGVGKLSDVASACRDSRIAPHAEIKGKFTVVDAKRHERYLYNFGTFYKDQIQHADVIILNRVTACENALPLLQKAIKEIAIHAEVICEPIDTHVLLPQTSLFNICDTAVCDCGEGEHHHDHTANEIFDTITIGIQEALDQKVLLDKLTSLSKACYGNIMRAKGIVPIKGGYANLQYVPGEASINNCDVVGEALCIIGEDLNVPALQALFRGK